MKLKQSIQVIMAFFAMTSFAYGQLEAKHVTIFKNGTAFIQKSGDVKATDGVYKWTNNLPQAIYGTFWFSSPTGEILSVKSKNDTLSFAQEWMSFFDLLKANKGNQADILLKSGETISGEVIGAKGGTVYGAILVKTSTGHTLVQVPEVIQVSIKEGLKETFDVEKFQTTISVVFKGSKSNQTLNTSYLSKGFNWTPMYNLVLTDENNGNLTLKASIKNDAEAIKNANLKLVVGNPNFLTTTQLSDLIDFNFNSFNGFNGDIRFKNTAGTFYESGAVEKRDNSNDASAVSLSDLYLFSIKNFSMEKGERAFYPLMETNVKLEHKYVCNLTPNGSVNNSTIMKKYSSFTEGSQFYHQLKIWNKSKSPFTAGTLMITKKVDGVQQALATGQLNYTAIGNCSYVTLSNSPDIEIKEEENEIERTNNTKLWNKNRYVAVKVQSTITIKNYKSSKAHLEVKRLVYGTMEKSDTDYEKTNVINQYYVNEGANVTWLLDLGPNEEKKINYSYTVYIRG